MAKIGTVSTAPVDPGGWTCDPIPTIPFTAYPDNAFHVRA